MVYQNGFRTICAWRDAQRLLTSSLGQILLVFHFMADEQVFLQARLVEVHLLTSGGKLRQTG